MLMVYYSFFTAYGTGLVHLMLMVHNSLFTNSPVNVGGTGLYLRN